MKHAHKIAEAFSDIDVKTNNSELFSFFQTGQFNDILGISGSFFYVIIDVPNNTFQYVSPWVKHVLGYSQDEFLMKGASLLSDICHPDISNTQKAIQEECANFLKGKSIKLYPYYKFSFDLVVHDFAGNNVRLLQHNRYIKVDKKGQPLLLLSILMKVHPGRNEIKQTLHISRMMPKGEKVLLKKDFYPKFENGILTKTEIEVWRLTVDGYSGKEIATKLDISVNTVNTHRKNINKKLKNS